MTNAIKPGDPLVAKWLGYEPQGVIFDEANEISEYVWRKLADKYSHSMMRDQMQRGAWPPDLVRYAVADSASRARRHALFHWRQGFDYRAASGREVTWTDRLEARAFANAANIVRKKKLPRWPPLRLFKVYLGTFRGQRFAVSELVE